MTSTIAQFILNHGAFDGKYDSETGLYSDIGKGIYDFRVGEDVVNVHTGRRQTVTALYPREDGCRGTPCTVEVDGWGRCCVLVVKPANPERITFGFVVQTLMDFEGKPVGGYSRYITREDAEAEVQRLKDVNYPGVVSIMQN